MTNLTYFTVVADFRSVVADLSTDLDHDPQIGPVTAVVTFKPLLRDGDAILAADATPRPTGFIAAPIVAKINSSGRLVLRDVPDGTRQIVDDIADLPGTGDVAKYYVADDTGIHYRWNGDDYDEILPYAPVRLLADTALLELDQPLYYSVAFSSVLLNGRAGRLKGFNFQAPVSDYAVSLIEVMPPPGQSAAQGINAPMLLSGDFNGDGDLVFTNADGSLLDPIGIPAGTLLFIDNEDGTWSVGA
jgi:hypothetical protein